MFHVTCKLLSPIKIFKIISRKIQKEPKVYLFLVAEDETSVLGKIAIEFNTMQDQSTVKRVYWLKDNKGISIAGVTLKALFMNDQVHFKSKFHKQVILDEILPRET